MKNQNIIELQLYHIKTPKREIYKYYRNFQEAWEEFMQDIKLFNVTVKEIAKFKYCVCEAAPQRLCRSKPRCLKR